MDQVSRPLLIVLASAVVLAALWLVALRPKDPDIANTPAAPVTAIAKAKDAAAASDAANGKLQAASGATEPTVTEPAATAATPAQATVPAKPAASTAADNAKNRDAAVVRDMRSGKVVVMLFWNAKGADDVATRGAVRAISRHGGKVAVHVIPISRVGQYRSITDGVQINQSPTVLVIGRKGSTRSIVGLTERGELNQAVSDALAGRR